MAKFSVKYEDNTGNGDSITTYDSIEAAEAGIQEDLENIEEYFRGRSYDYADFGCKTEIWECGGDEYASWTRLWEAEVEGDKFFCEIVQDHNGLYYANLTVGGNDSNGEYHGPMLVEGLPEYVSYKALASGIRDRTGISIPERKALHFTQCQRKRYAFIDGTQYLGRDRGCVVTLAEVRAGHKPNFA